MKKIVNQLLLIIIIINVVLACKDKNKEEQDTGKLSVNFTHWVGNEELEYDTVKYTNKAGNKYLVSEIQYFISRVELIKVNGEKVTVKSKNIHYIDTDIDETKVWNIADEIPIGEYKGINFILGFLPEDNKDRMYVNPPESMMFWPEHLGGGYHAMKLNGKWERNDSLINFNTHIGRGKTGEGIFIDNYCKVQLNKNFSIGVNSQKRLILKMDVNKWYENPNIYDHNVYGSGIMQNQEAMHKICENGIDVFSIQ